MESLDRRKFMGTVVAGTLGATLYTMGCQKKQAAKKLNIIYIMADDLGYGDLGCYGQKQIKTPNIDKMASEGLRFTDHYAGSTVCAPSRCSLMTGLHTGHTFVRGNKEVKPMGQIPIPDSTMTVAEYLKEAGYYTGLIGKWGLGGPGSEGAPNRQGFDYFFGYLCQRHAHNYYPEFLFRNEDRVPLPGNKVANPRPDGAGVAIKRTTYSHDLLAADALDFVEKHKDEPFFLYLALTLPHANNEAKDKGMEVPDYGIYADKDWPQPEKGKAAMISRLDRDVGRLLDKLRELGIEKNTLVFFTSDNGPHKEGGVDPSFFKSSGPLRGIKRDLYEGGIRVPMIAWCPGTIKPNTTTNHISAFWDFLPTACEIAGVDVPDNTDGISYLPTLLRKPPQPEHEYLYWEYFGWGFKQAVRMGKYKAVRNGGFSAPLELYDLETDIGETKDIAKEHPDIVARMKEIMKTARTESAIWKVPDA